MIQVENLIYNYPDSEKPALKNIDFEVKEGEVFGFLGPSGAGKSTTQKVMNGILKNYKGKVIVNGHEVSKIHRSFYEQIGVAFEFPNLYSRLTALENLKLFASFYKTETEDSENLLEMVGLLADKNTRVEAFSKGMKMRLNFVRALINKPKLLFLDEPTSGLDPVNARQMKDIIIDMKNKGVTIFLTTHNMADADELCDRLAFMVNGQLPVINETKALKLQHGKKLVRVNYKDKGNIISNDFELTKLSENEAFQHVLKHNEIETIHTMEASLEDIFIKITGQKLS